MTLNHLKGYKTMLILTTEQCVELWRIAYIKGDTLKAELYDTIGYLMREVEALQDELEEQKDRTHEAQGALKAIRVLLTNGGY